MYLAQMFQTFALLTAITRWLMSYAASAEEPKETMIMEMVAQGSPEIRAMFPSFPKKCL